jgi:hypothetical protein
MPGDDDYDDDELALSGADDDDDSLRDLVGPEMWKEVCQLNEDADFLLTGMRASNGQKYMQRVSLDISRGLYLVAQYVVGRAEFNRTAEQMDEAMEDKGKEGRAARRAVRERLAQYLMAALQEELKTLVSGEHPLMLAEMERRGVKTERLP